MNQPLVSIIVPCRNEADFIGRCLDSLLAQSYPEDKIEILVIDGASTDGTREIVKSYTQRSSRVKLFDNPRRFTPISMNIGIQNSRGDLITKSDGHTIYPPDYLSKCVRYLEEYKADAVGGITVNVPANNSLAAKAIVEVLGSPLGGGGAFRRSGGKPQLADTAFGICYRKEVFDKIGLFNEKLISSQDLDLNLRLTQTGGKILLAPDIALTYYPKQKTLISFWRRNFFGGIWVILPMKYDSPIFKPRHLVPLVFISTLLLSAFGSLLFTPLIWAAIGILALYLAVVFYFSLKIVLRERMIQLLPFLILAFAVRHFGHGLGSIVGVIKLFIPGREN